MNEWNKEFAPRDADNQKIVAAILASAVCTLSQSGMDTNDAIKAVIATYEYFLTSPESGSGSCLAVWEMLKNT